MTLLKDETLSKDTAAPASYSNGIPYDSAGNVAIEFLTPIVAYSNGLPMTATGRIAASNAPIVAFSAAQGYDASGKVTSLNPLVEGVLAAQTNAESETITPVDASTFFAAGFNPISSYALEGASFGLSINPTTGVITGTLPNDASDSAPYSVIVVATDSEGNETRARFTWNVDVTIPSIGVPIGNQSDTQDSAITPLDVSGSFVGATEYGASNIPTGLSFDPATGIFTGTPTVSAIWTTEVSGYNAAGRSISYTLDWTVSATSAVPGNIEATWENNNTGGAGSIAVTVSGATVGNLLVAVLAAKNSGTGSATINSVTGWTERHTITDADGNRYTAGVWTRTATGDANDNFSVSWTGRDARPVARVFSLPNFDGVIDATSIDASESNNQTATSVGCGSASAVASATYQFCVGSAIFPTDWDSDGPYPDTTNDFISSTAMFDQENYYAPSSSNPSIFAGILLQETTGAKTNTWSTTRSGTRCWGAQVILTAVSSGGSPGAPPDPDPVPPSPEDPIERTGVTNLLGGETGSIRPFGRAGEDGVREELLDDGVANEGLLAANVLTYAGNPDIPQISGRGDNFIETLWVRGWPLRSGRIRSELKAFGGLGSQVSGNIYWRAFSVFIPNDASHQFVGNQTIVGGASAIVQWHLPAPEGANTIGFRKGFFWWNWQGIMPVGMEEDLYPVSDGLGRWNNFILGYKLSQSSDGWLYAWRSFDTDPWVQFAAYENQATMRNISGVSEADNYLNPKLGIYRKSDLENYTEWTQLRYCYDDHRLGDEFSDANSMRPGGTPVLTGTGINGPT